MTDSEKIIRLEKAMLAFFQSTTQREAEETGEYWFALAMEALIEGEDLSWAWLCMKRSGNLGFAQAHHLMKQVLIDGRSSVSVLSSFLVSCAKDFMRWKYSENCDYENYIKNKIKSGQFFLDPELDNLGGGHKSPIDENVLISFEMFMDDLLSNNPDYYSQLNSKYQSGQLNKRLALLNGITDMADLYNEFYKL